jgi:hypothetical protein
MIFRFRKVAKDLYRGSAPTPVDVVVLKKKIGLKKIVSLDQLSGMKIDKISNLLGIEHIIIPITASKESLMKLFHYDFKKLFLEDGPTFVHCAAGKDRTGLVIAIIKCKYFNEDPEKAIDEAKSLGFGVGIDPKITNLYETLIRNCKNNKDINNADIVSNEREYLTDDTRGSFLPPGQQGSFAPYLDQTKTYPSDEVYNFINEQSPTRENYQKEWADKKIDNEKYNINENSIDIPLIGLYNNDSGIHGVGPVESPGGFLSD